MDKLKIARIELRLVYVFIVLCLALGAYGFYQSNHKTYLVCQRTEQIKHFGVVLAERSNASIGSIKYYKTHPEDLRAAVANNNYVIKSFKPKPCNPGILGLF